MAKELRDRRFSELDVKISAIPKIPKQLGSRGRPAIPVSCPHCGESCPSKIHFQHIHLPECTEYDGHGGGQPKVERVCPFCRKPFGVMALRAHEPGCPKNPKNKEGTTKK